MNREASCLFTLGSIYYEAGEVRQAVEAFEQCLVLRRKTRDKIGLAEALNKLGLTYCDIGYDLRAMDYFEQSLVICEDNADLWGQAVCLQHLGNVFKMQKDNALAIDFFERCLAVRAKVGDTRGMADCHDSLGLVYFDIGDIKQSLTHCQDSLEIRISGDPPDVAAESECYKCIGTSYMVIDSSERAAGAFQRCLDIQRQLGNTPGEIDALISLGLAHSQADNLQIAITHLEEALDLFQHIPPEDASAHSGKAVCLDHLGNVYALVGQSDKSVTYYTMSLRVKKDIGDMTGEARCLVRIGLEFLSLNELQRAFEAFTEALHMFERLEDDHGISICYENLGDTYMKMGEVKQAIFSFDRCLPIKVETWDKIGEAQCLDNLGLAHYSMGELRLAAEYYEQSMAIWKAEGNKQCLMACCESLGSVAFQLGEHMRSIECYVQHLTLSQEIGDGAADHEILLRLGLSNAAIGEYQVALQFLQQAMSFYIELHDVANRALCLQHIGSVYGRLGDSEEGMRSLEESMKLRTEAVDKLGIADCFQEMGLLCYNQKDQHRARGFFGQAQRLIAETNDKASIATCTMHIGATYVAQGEIKEGIQQFKTALMADVDGNWAGKVDCLNHLGAAQTRLGDPQATKSFELALSNLRDKGFRAEEANMLVQLAQAHCKLRDFRAALERLEQCLEVRKSFNDKRGQAEVLIRLVYLHTSLRNFTHAQDALEECTALCAELGDQLSQIEVLNARAILLVHQGRVREAIAKNHEALEQLKALQDTKGVAECLSNLAVCYTFAGDFNNATAHAVESGKLFAALEDGTSEALVARNLGLCQVELGELPDAVGSFELAIELHRARMDASNQALCLINIGAVCVRQGDPERAQSSLDAALSLLRQSGDKQAEARCLHNIGTMLFNAGDTAEAVDKFDSALSLFRECGDAREAITCLHSLRTAHMRLGDAFQASQTVHLLQEHFPEEEVMMFAQEVQKELEAARAAGDQACVATHHVSLASALMEIDADAAMQHAQKALMIRKRTQEDGQGIAEAYARLGDIEVVQGRAGTALVCYKQAGMALGEVWRGGTRERIELGADVMQAIGNCYISLEQWEEAVQVLIRCRIIRNELKDAEGAYDCCNSLAIALARTGQVDKATDMLREGIGGAYVSAKTREGSVVSTLGLVSTLVHVRRHEEALRAIALNQSNLNLYKEKENHAGEAACYWALAKAYAAIDHLQQSADSYSLCYQLRLLSGERSDDLMETLRRKGLAMVRCGDVRSGSEDLETWVKMINEQLEAGEERGEATAVPREIEALVALAHAYLRLGDTRNGAEVLKRGLALANAEQYRRGEAEILMGFGEFYRTLWISRRALDHYEKAVDIIAELEDTNLEATCIMEMGKLNFARGDTVSAIKCLEEALLLAKKMPMGSVKARVLLAIGDVHLQQGDHAQAQTHYSASCQACKEQLDPIGESAGLLGLARSYLMIGRTSDAMDQVTEALKIRKSLGDRKGESEALRLLSEVYLMTGKYVTARVACDSARNISGEAREVVDRAQAWVLQGRIMFESGDVEGALEQLKRSRDMHASTTTLGGTKIFLEPRFLAESLHELGKVYMHLGQRLRAIECLQQAEQISEAAEDVSGLASARAALALLLASKGTDESEKPEDLATAEAKLVAAKDARQKHGNRAGVAECQLVHGVIALKSGKTAIAVQKLQLANGLFDELRDRRSEARALVSLGEACAATAEGAVHFESALRIRSEILDLSGEAECSQHLAELQSRSTDRDLAIKTWIDTLNLRKQLGQKEGQRIALVALIGEFEHSNQPQRAKDCAKDLLELTQGTDNADAQSLALLLIGRVQLHDEEYAAAIESLRQTIELCAAAPNSSKAVLRTAEAWEMLVECYTKTGQDAAAADAARQAADRRSRIETDDIRNGRPAQQQSYDRRLQHAATVGGPTVLATKPAGDMKRRASSIKQIFGFGGGSKE